MKMAPSEQQRKMKAVNIFVPERNNDCFAVRAGPSTHYVAGLFTQALHVVRVLGRPEADLEQQAIFQDAALADLIRDLQQLQEPVGSFCEALQHTYAGERTNKMLEVPLSAYVTRAWNTMVTKLSGWPEEVRAGLVVSHLQPLKIGHVDGFCGMGGSSLHPLQAPLKQTEAKHDLDLVGLEMAIALQVENEVAQINELHYMATNSQELRVPCFQERFSHSGYLLDLLVPAQQGDMLVACRTGDVSPQPHKLVMLRIPLVRLQQLPSGELGLAVYSALLVAMKALAEMYMHEAATQTRLTRTDWHRPLKELVMTRDWVPCGSKQRQDIRPRLLHYVRGDEQLMVKVFDYYFRSKSEDSLPQSSRAEAIPLAGMRQAPAPKLLAGLKQAHPEVYGSWEVIRFQPLYSVLKYKRAEGSFIPLSWVQFVAVLDIIVTAHSLGYCHGDVLPQNIIYHVDGQGATVLDWDWASYLDSMAKALYVSGFNYDDLKEYRHADAQAGNELSMTHDCWALAQIADQFFEVPAQAWLARLREAAELTSALVEEVRSLDCAVLIAQSK